VRKGDAVQASEKGYRAAEGVVKALAERLDVPEHGQAVKESRWYAHLLASAAASCLQGSAGRSRRAGRWL
jgi:organic hydroperoxide reductase OsmC/OhrA